MYSIDWPQFLYDFNIENTIDVVFFSFNHNTGVIP